MAVVAGRRVSVGVQRKERVRAGGGNSGGIELGDGVAAARWLADGSGYVQVESSELVDGASRASPDLSSTCPPLAIAIRSVDSAHGLCSV